MIIWTAYTGSKLKGLWTNEEQALRYGAQNAETTILMIDTDLAQQDEKVNAMRKLLTEALDAPKPVRTGEVHHLVSKSITVGSGVKNT